MSTAEAFIFGFRLLLVGLRVRRDIAGRTPPIRAWRIVSESGVNNRFAALRATSLATLPLIGRDEEQEIFQCRWERACGGDGQVVVLSGEPGIGKSRLNAAFQAAVARIGRTHERQGMRESFRAFGSKLPGGRCLIIIGTEGDDKGRSALSQYLHLVFSDEGGRKAWHPRMT